MLILILKVKHFSDTEEMLFLARGQNAAIMNAVNFG